MKQLILKATNSKYTLGILLGAFFVSSLFALLYFGFGGFGIFLKTEPVFWTSFVASILLAYAVIKQWKSKRGNFGATDAIFTFFIAFISFWVLAYAVITIWRTLA